MRKLTTTLAAAFCLLLAACSETSTQTKKEPEKPPEPASGLSALFKMYQVARTWAIDAQVLKMNSIPLSEVPDVPRGRAAAWQATFTSDSHNQARTYTYSIVESAGNLHKGVFAGQPEAWSGAHGADSPFPMIAVKIDTDAAYQTALAQAGDYDKKNPGKPISFTIEKITRFPDPVWRVIWGESVGTSNFSVYVDASTGAFQEKMH